ncbi:MAG: outer membrane beta barrel protein [Melioribacteraceae bacterium]|nr:MAG: outer membrane beta barrel protein [Melioribacteraceae bacterium]
MLKAKQIYLFFLFFLFIIFSHISAQDDDFVKFGGAVRYNLLLQDYESDMNTNDGQFTWDTWRLNVKAKTNGVLLDFEYRFYPTFGTHFIHHGWLGWDFNKNLQMQLGVTQVPFGNLTYASHSWWFQIPYYVGLEDDYDMGVKFIYTKDNFELNLAYFMQPEPAGPGPGDVSYGVGGSGRYSYDVIPSTGASNQERNQFNLRGTYNIVHGKKSNTKVGLSAQYGGIYNSVLDEVNPGVAFAGHVDGNYGRFNVKAEYITYSFDAKDDTGAELTTVAMGAYGSGTYPVAAEASMGVIGVSYTLPVELGPISSLVFYDDYSIVMKAEDAFEDTQHNVLGFLAIAGNIYTYFDIAMGKNQPWLTDNFGTGLGAGVPGAEWNMRYNINIGYYF